VQAGLDKIAKQNAHAKAGDAATMKPRLTEINARRPVQD
jgi:hypothetical protein